MLAQGPEPPLQDLADARIEIEEAVGEPLIDGSATAGAGPEPSLLRRALPWAAAVVGMVAVVLGVWTITRPTPPAAEPTSLVIPLPLGDTLRRGANRGKMLALSPDGQRLVYAAQSGDTQRLYLRRLDRFEATPILGTEGAYHPFFSPNGNWIGLFSAGDEAPLNPAAMESLKKVPVPLATR